MNLGKRAEREVEVAKPSKASFDKEFGGRTARAKVGVKGTLRPMWLEGGK